MAAEPRATRPDQPARHREVTATGSRAAPPSSDTAAPLSVAQEALWYRAILAPTALTYNEAISIRKDGPVDTDALRRAFNAIVSRHTAWRTTFDTVNGEPVQVLGPVPVFELPVLDLSELSPEQAERHASEMVAEAARVPYDVRHGPLLRPRLIRFPDDHHRLYLAMHHLIFDGVSLTRVVLPELTALYEAFRTGGADPLSEVPADYADFARWEQAWVEQPRLERRREHWRRRLQEAPTLALALDHPRPPASESLGGALGLSVPAHTVERMRRVGQGAGGTLFQALAAVWALLLASHAGQEDVVFAVAADMRHRPEFESLVGCALTPLAVRLDLTGDPTFHELVVRARNDLLDGLDNVMPFERLVRDLRPDAQGANPIYQTMLVLEPATVTPDPTWSLHQIDSQLADAVGAAKLDLELQLDERSHGGLSGQLIYDRQLFERSTAARLLDHWLALIEAAAAEPSAPISRLSALAPGERQQLAEWNATHTELHHSPVHERVSERARRQPQAIAVSDGALGISYAELDRRSDQGTDPVPATGGPCGQLVVDALAALKAGGALRLTAADGRIVEITHAAAVNEATALAAELGITPADTILVLPASLARDPVSALWTGLIAGARIVVAPDDVAGDGARLRRLIRAEEVTFLQASPREWEALIDSGLRSVRGLRALCGGGKEGSLSPELAERILERCRVLWNGYAAAETSGYATLGQVEAHRPVTIGRPLANTRTYVIDAHGRPVPVGVPGELLIAGEGVATGYADGNNGGERFVSDPFGAGPALRTGERVRRRADGQVELAPRSLKATTGIEPV
jgi:non-ribosomal peptide synthetase component F